MLRCVSSRPRVLVLRRPCMPAVRRAPPRRGWATHKDLPDPPKKPAPETAQRRLDLENSRFDGAELKKLADSITPREAEFLRQIDDPSYEKQSPKYQMPPEPKPLWKLLLSHIASTKTVTGPQPVGESQSWQDTRRPFDRPLSLTTLASMLLLILLWLYYTNDYESDIKQVLAELNANPSPERQHQLLEKLHFLSLGLSQQLRRMLAPQSESFEELGVTAALVKAIASGDEKANEWGYTGLATFLAAAPETVPPPRLGKISKPLTMAILRDILKESNLQRDINLNMWRVFLAFSHQYEFARSVPTDVLVYITNRVATLSERTVLSSIERDHLDLLRRILPPLSSNERADRFFNSQANAAFQKEYTELKAKYPIPSTLKPVDLAYPFVAEATYGVLGAMLWSGLTAGRISPLASTIGIRPMWRLARPHFSSLMTASVWSATGAIGYLLARTQLTAWPDKTVHAVRSKIAGEAEPSEAPKRIPDVLGANRAVIGPLVAGVVANLPHASGVILGMAALDLIRSRHGLRLHDRNTIRTEAARYIERLKADTKSWASEKVYGSGPRY